MNADRAVEKGDVLRHVLFRLFILTALLVSAVIIQMATPEVMPVLPFYYILLAGYGASVLFFLAYLWGRQLVVQAYAQIVFDLLLITALVHISGGVASSTYFLYLFPIIAASLVISGRAGFLAAALSAVLFGTLVDATYFGLIPYFSPEHAVESSLGSLLVTIFIAWAVFFVIAFLMNYLTASLRKAREALRAAEKELIIRERLSEAGRVSASLAHEIRNPLAAISGSVQVLERELVLDPGQRELMGIILRESQRVSNILEQFLDFALPAKTVFSPIDLPGIMDETIKILKAGGVMNGKIEVSGNFRQISLLYHGNAGQFKQLFWNLLKNAVAAMPEGGRMTVDFDRLGRREIRVRVADTGHGLTAEDKAHLFEPFYSGFANGRGLGLAVVRRIVDDYDGRIEVRSEPDRGTEVVVTLPDRKPADPPG